MRIYPHGFYAEKSHNPHNRIFCIHSEKKVISRKAFRALSWCHHCRPPVHHPPATKSMDQLRGHLQSVLHQREQEREMLEQNDRVIEQGITNIQSVRRFLSDSVQELRRTGDPTILSKYEEILRLIYQEEDKALAFSRQHVREAERKNATIQQLRQTLDNLAVITSDHTRWVQISYISFHELSYPSL